MTKEQQTNGLVGKLTDIAVGDRIRMWTETPGNSSQTYEAVGYVRGVNNDCVDLSVGHPLNDVKQRIISGNSWVFTRYGYTGDKEGFKLGRFTDFSILKDSGQSIKEDTEGGLQERLKEVNVGDIIRLWKTIPGNSRKSYEVMGYVGEVSDKYVRLSMQHPTNQYRTSEITDPVVEEETGRRYLNVSSSRIKLKNFDFCAVQAPKQEESERKND